MAEHEILRVVRTSAGMCALWQPEAFDFVQFEDWENWATEDRNIVESISSGLIVPINVGGDGVFQISVRWGRGAGLTAPERLCLLGSSEPYLLVSDGWFALGGLEDVGDAEFASANKNALAVGRYSVTVHLIDWEMDPASVDSSGRPTENALPDFVVVIGTAIDGAFRTRVRTFAP